MRNTRTVQPSVFQAPEVVHPIAAELERASEWLDQHPELHFARVDPFRVPRKSALQSAISAIDVDAWRSINGVLLQDAKGPRIEPGTQVRFDSTVTETDILEPSDSRLLYDGVRVLTRLLRQGRERVATVSFRDHCRAAKRREQEIRSARGARRREAIYRRLLSLVAKTIAYAKAAVAEVCCVTEPWAESWCAEVRAYRDLLRRVVEQTRRRVLNGETVPASEKVVSLFEPHTDIIRKGGRTTHYGHKINLSTGRSALVLDVVVEAGNPADSERCLPLLRRHVENYGEPPRRVAFDGGYASRANLAAAKELGVEHDAVGLDLWATHALSGRPGSRHFLSEAVLRPGPLQLARLGTFPGLGALGGVRPQLDEAGSPAAILTLAAGAVRLFI